MATQSDEAENVRIPLSRERILEAAVQLADNEGLDALSMRRLGQELGVEAMSLYNHIDNKEDLLDGMAEWVVGEIDLIPADPDWKSALRSQMLGAREVMYRHEWAPKVIESRVELNQTTIAYFDSLIGLLRAGDLSLDLIHHSMHVIGSRILGFTQELFDDSGSDDSNDEEMKMMLTMMADVYPNMAAMMEEIQHQEETILGSGCDDQVEFLFTIDLMLDGIERIHQAESANG